MSRSPRRSSPLPMRLAPVVLLSVLSLAGCKQQEGERCELNSDCEGDLECVEKTATGTGGICRPRGYRSTPLDGAVADTIPPLDIVLEEVPPPEPAVEPSPDTGPEASPDTSAAPDAGQEVGQDAIADVPRAG